MNGDPIARRAGTQSRIRVPYWGTDRTYSSALGSHCRIPRVCWRRAKTPTPIRPPSTGGGLPVCTGPNFEKEKNL